MSDNLIESETVSYASTDVVWLRLHVAGVLHMLWPAVCLTTRSYKA